MKAIGWNMAGCRTIHLSGVKANEARKNKNTEGCGRAFPFITSGQIFEKMKIWKFMRDDVAYVNN